MREYNKEKEVFNNQVYCIFGDGCYQEGITQEAFSLAAHYRLDNLTFIYDYNKMTIDGSTEISMSENIDMRFQALGMEVINIKDGDSDLDSMREALKRKTDRTKVIILNTTIGMGSDWAGENRAHGIPLGKENIEKMKSTFNLKEFVLSEETAKFYESVRNNLRNNRKEWNLKFKGTQIRPKLKSTKIEDFINNLDLKVKSTRKHFGDAINQMINCGELIGGAGDVTPSTNTKANNIVEFTSKCREGTYIRYGVREHGMFAAMNGMASYGQHIPFGGSFLNFLTYGFPSVRLACLGKLHTIYIFSHDSIGLGEDGPTHQPIEVFPLMRATPRLIDLRPADGLETRCALWWAINNHYPSCICLSRQDVPLINSSKECLKGAYYVEMVENPKFILIASGSEVAIAVEAMKNLKKKGIEGSVVSLMSFKIFEMQSNEYKKSILLDTLRVSVEASSVFGWERYAHKSIGIDTFGLSGKYEDLYEHFGFTPKKIADKVENWLKEWNN